MAGKKAGKLFPLIPPYSIMKEKTLTAILATVFALAVSPLSLFAQEAPSSEAPAAPDAGAPSDDTAVITVDGTPITVGDVREMFNGKYAGQFQQLPPEQQAMFQAQIQQMILSELVSKTLLLNAAKKEEIAVDEEKYKEAIAEIEANLPDGKSLEEFAKSVGVDVERVKNQVRDENKIQQLVDSVTESAEAPDDAAVKKYFEENPGEFEMKASVSASHILLSTPSDADEETLAEAKKEAEDIRSKLLEDGGKDFAEMATTHSDCPSKAKGGDLGKFSAGQMVPEFEKAAFEQEVGAIGEPVKTQFGYHIIKVTDRTEAKQLAFNDVKEDLAKNLLEKTKNEKMQAYLGELREKADIKQVGGPGPGGAEPAPEAAPQSKPSIPKPEKKDDSAE